MSQYATIVDVKLYGIMPSEDVDALEAAYPGIVLALVKGVSAHADSLLAKRYGAPFQTPYPDALVFNVVQVVVGRLYLKRGYNPSSQQDQLIKGAHDAALAWFLQAADSEKGLVELPVKQANPSGGPGGVTLGAPLGYSEASPYTWTDRQAEAVRGGC